MRAVLIALALALAQAAGHAVASPSGVGPAPQVVRSAAQLAEALGTATAGSRIVVARGEYAIERPLEVPDGVALEGEGVMSVDADGLPAGFAPGTETVLRVARAFDGPVLALGNGSSLRGLRVLDLANIPSQPAPRRGNAVTVVSRGPGDAVAARVVECELVNANPVGFSDAGPHGHGIVVLTLNPGLGAPPAAHEGARVGVRVQRSLVRTHTGAALFAANFAARGEVSVTLEDNRLEGYLTVAGGVSRPDPVTDAVLRIDSRRNLYQRSGSDRHGWLLIAGSTSPHHVAAGGHGASRITVRVDSTGDRIEGFRHGIEASAARRLDGRGQPLADNRLDLALHGTRLRSRGDGAADVVLRAALSEVAPATGLGDFPAGDGNALRVSFDGVDGSGRRDNVYQHVAGPRADDRQGAGNRLEIVGEAAAFGGSNPGLDPPPAPGFFVTGP